MKLTETLMQDIACYEETTGRPVRSELLPLLRALAAVCDSFHELGTKDAIAGRSQREKTAFIEWGKQEMKDPQEEIMPFIELIYTSYIEGLNAGAKEQK